MIYSVILVDDESIFLEFMQKVIDWEGQDCEIVATAKSGEEALEKIKELQPDIAFMDISMASMNGLEVCEQLKALDIPTEVVITTAHDNFRYARQAIKLEVSDYLLKPFNAEELLHSLRIAQSAVTKLREAHITARENALFRMVENIEIDSSYGIDDMEVFIDHFERAEYDLVDIDIIKLFGVNNEGIFSFQYALSVYHTLVVTVYNRYQNNIKSNRSDFIKKQLLIANRLNDCSTAQQLSSVLRESVFELLSDCMPTQKSGKKQILVQRIEQFLRDNYQNTGLTVDDIARELYFENSYLRRTYKSITGMTIINRLEEIRLSRAKELLKLGEIVQSEIAELCGFSDQYYFSKRFKQVCGETPSEYRNRVSQIKQNV